MLAEPTVFVVGAGAGSRIGMPLGWQLSDRIAQKLDITTNDYSSDPSALTGDAEIAQILRRLAAEQEESSTSWFPAARAVSKGIHYTKSVDAFLNTHRDDERVKRCAKLAIVQSILAHEKSCALVVQNEVDREWLSATRVFESWLVDFLDVLQAGVIASENPYDVFKNLTIINFNYDRCIEQFLFFALRDLFCIDSSEAAELMRTLRIYHPYGVVGSLEWQPGNPSIRFGASYSDLLGLSDKIITFHEQIEDASSELLIMREAITQARRIVFLGFHFHDPNVRLLEPVETEDKDPIDVYATFKSRSQADAEVVGNRLRKAFRGRGGVRILKLETGSDCESLLRDYHSVLQAPRTEGQGPEWQIYTGPDNL
jgi:hypothetical protein